MDAWLLEHLACPRCRTAVRVDASQEHLLCVANHSFPIVDREIPLMLLSEAEQTHWVASYALEHFGESDPFDARPDGNGIDPAVQEAIGGTCGNLYGHLQGKLKRYPIPDLDLEAPRGTTFLDVGCHWGRWCISAARKGWRVVGIDPSLTGVRAAKRVARELGVDALFVIGDGRFLPFKDNVFEIVHSYSVLQHFAYEDVTVSLNDIGRVLVRDGRAYIQMPQATGVRNLMQQARRGFRPARAFEVRYWSASRLRSAFSEAIGPTTLSVDGFFSLNAQLTDLDLLPWRKRGIVRLSSALRALSRGIPPLTYMADSVYVRSIKR